MSQHSIAREIRRLTEIYNKGKEKQGCSSREELIQRKDNLVRRIDKRVASIKGLLKRTDMLCQQLGFRMKKLKHVMRGKQHELLYKFNVNLMKKGLRGNTKFDMENKTLSMEVIFPDGANEAVKDIKSLSGGERSFTTLAYALALHDMTNTPFRAMDEFDIFMDAVTRKISLDTVVNRALDPNKERSQWIFITPHDISSVVADNKFVKKQSMHAPRA
eukprot:TRINITY_DN1522_c0_g1_i1.p1 TRINITY_DN1522_c0_g1~~TRINITY_DN1522_c0_g1_i1.p1  ORF type:complete len:217 (-),score=57.79 TRINITY_DN1522_c0_g1_i1:96-746(-)